MSNHDLIIFDDGRGAFGPLTRLRAVFDQRSGVWTNRERIEADMHQSAAGLMVRADLEAVYREREPEAWINPPLGEAFGDKPAVVLINGRWNTALSPGEVRQRLKGLGLNQALCQRDGQLLAACVDPGQARSIIEEGYESLVHELAIETLEDEPLIDRPWHMLDELEATVLEDLRHPGLDEGVDASASVHPTAVLDRTAGPIAIAQHATVGPLAVIEGPASIGAHSVVQPHAYIRPYTVVGPACKVAGEISASIIQGHTNKAHAGYLGNALLGQWINLGAQTNVSNLKNTFGTVRVHLPSEDLSRAAWSTASNQPTMPPAQDTQRMRHGPIIGDYVRTAIGTRLPTGAVIDLGSMIAVSAFAPKYTPPLTFLTDTAQAAYDLDKFIETARIAMSKRGMSLGSAMEAVLGSYG